MLSQGHKGAPLYRYIARLALDLGILGDLRNGNDAPTSWLRLISTSNFIHPYETYAMCLSHWEALSRPYEYGCTHIPLHLPSWPQMCESRFTCGVKIYKQLNKLPLILLYTIRIDNSRFDCHVLPQQGRDGATGSGTRFPTPLELVWNDLSLSEKPVTG
jgi:hypothetical protein